MKIQATITNNLERIQDLATIIKAYVIRFLLTVCRLYTCYPRYCHHHHHHHHQESRGIQFGHSLHNLL